MGRAALVRTAVLHIEVPNPSPATSWLGLPPTAALLGSLEEGTTRSRPMPTNGGGSTRTAVRAIPFNAVTCRPAPPMRPDTETPHV